MRVIPGGRKTTRPLDKERNGLLAKIHIAKAQLGLSEQEYRAVIRGFGADSAAQLSIPVLEDVVRYMKKLGFKPLHARWYRKDLPRDLRLKALRERALGMSDGIENGRRRLDGLVKKICDVEALEWCADESKLKRLLKVLGKIQSIEGVGL